MAVFLVDNDKTYTYEDLFCSLNHAIEYCPLLKTRDVYVYFVNLIRALTANRPLVLLDSDLNPSYPHGFHVRCKSAEKIHPYHSKI